MSVADVVLRKRRKRRHSLLHHKRNLRNSNVTQPLRNVNNVASSRNNDASRTSSVEPIVQQVQRELNDLCDNNSRRANASQHQRDRNHNRNNDA